MDDYEVFSLSGSIGRQVDRFSLGSLADAQRDFTDANNGYKIDPSSSNFLQFIGKMYGALLFDRGVDETVMKQIHIIIDNHQSGQT